MMPLCPLQQIINSICLAIFNRILLTMLQEGREQEILKLRTLKIIPFANVLIR